MSEVQEGEIEKNMSAYDDQISCSKLHVYSTSLKKTGVKVGVTI